MRVVVPFAAENPKTRLSGVLDADERAAFARAMLADVLDAVRNAGRTPTVLATAPVDVDASVRVDDRSLTTAVNAVLDEDDGSVAVVMADLPLVTSAVLDRLFDADGDVVIAPGRGAGTNALVVRDDEFHTDFHGASYLDHREAAAAVGAEVTVVDSHRLATDVDERADLVEVLVHGDGRAATWLANNGVRIERGNGRVNAVRVDD
ncbi:2-phospho-L-lactate guanylyltransferase [Haloarchaeobius litoreus]|uniref:2-phospho-L-lactate guanylyltransferase n=1 Tax=Haloarchaeobius litoreus TaxID=755306 RepID=A0ABD6DQ67_9EURY|nr:2-phospho-L-lactate guanylyltransferase [Haloarchaeobius litoreus]